MNNKFGLVIHGGAGVITKGNMTPLVEKNYKDALIDSLKAGYEILKLGGSSIDAVVAAIKIMEDSPLFNAGKGSVFNNEGKNEMDASIMDGKNLMAGSVAGVRTIKNPITAALTVMNKSSHIMMIGEGAEKFAKLNGLDIEDPSYFYTERRWQQLQKIKETEIAMLDHNIQVDSGKDGSNLEDLLKNKNLGTVGAVALDINGNIAAGTSTGGMTNKKYGRIGDSPIIGAGTYANNKTCAISCTGSGEYFIRTVGAYDVSAMMEYKGLSLKESAERYVMEKLLAIKGDGGLIGIDANRNIVMPFNTEGMYRGYVLEDGQPRVFLYEDEESKKLDF